MKLKKLVLGIATSFLVFSLTACGADPRKEFVASMYSTDTSEFNAAKFEMNIKDLTYNDEQGDAAVRMVANQLKDMTIDGAYAFDEKAKAIELELNLNLLGQKIPLQMVGEKDSLYMSTSFISGITDLATAFGSPIDFSTSDLAKLEGKYINIAEIGNTLTDGKTAKNENLFKNAFSTDTKKKNDELKKFIESFDKKSFKKDKDTLTHTFTKEEFIKILEFANKNFKDDKEYKKAGLDKQVSEAIKTIKKDFNKLEMKLSINQKTKKTDMELTLGMRDSTNKVNDVSIVLAVSMTPQKNKEKIKLPVKKDIMTQEELTSMLNGISGVAAPPTTTDPKKKDALDNSTSSDLQAANIDEALDLMIEEINKNAADLDATTADEIRKSLEPSLNAEQMKKLNDVLDKALVK